MLPAPTRLFVACARPSRASSLLLATQSPRLPSHCPHPSSCPFAQTAGTYVNASGPRFETKAEIRSFALSGQVLGMTAAHEATACGELGLKFGMLCAVDNMCHGIGAPFDLDAFHAAQDANRGALERTIAKALPAIEAVARRAGPAVAPADMDESVTPKASTSSSSSSSSSSSTAAASAAEPSAKTGAAAAAAAAATDAVAAGGKAAADMVIHARWIVPVEPTDVVYEHHAVVVRDGLILAIMPSHEATARFEASTVVRKPHHAIMPGFVNAHTHLGMTALRGLGDDKPLFEWLTTAIWPTEGRLMSAEYVRAGVRIGLAEMIRGGTTCVNDMYFFPNILAEELIRSGMRGCIGPPIMEFPSAWAGGADDYLAKAEEAITASRAKDPLRLLSHSIAPHAPYTVKDATFTKCLAAAERLDVRLHVHLHETKAEVDDSVHGSDTPNRHLSANKCSPVTNLLRLGVLSSRTIAVHMANLTDEHIEEAAASGAHVVHCPHSNMKLASGFCRVLDLQKAGVNVAIGTDSCASNNKLDMMAEMRTTALLAKVVASDPTAVGATTALRMATLNGAKAIGQEDRTGSLVPGKSADFITVDMSSIEALPMYDVQSHLVYVSDRSHVTDVWVHGRRLMADRKLTSIDYDAAVASAHAWAVRVKPTCETEGDDEDA